MAFDQITWWKPYVAVHSCILNAVTFQPVHPILTTLSTLTPCWNISGNLEQHCDYASATLVLTSGTRNHPILNCCEQQRILLTATLNQETFYLTLRPWTYKWQSSPSKTIFRTRGVVDGGPGSRPQDFSKPQGSTPTLLRSYIRFLHVCVSRLTTSEVKLNAENLLNKFLWMTPNTMICQFLSCYVKWDTYCFVWP